MFKSPVCRVWGWATWRDRWEEHLRICTKVLSKQPLVCLQALPKQYRTVDAAIRLADCQSGAFDTWDYEWNFTHIFSGGYSLTPNAIHCLNLGFRRDATHTICERPPWSKLSPWDARNDKIMLMAPTNNIPGDSNKLLEACGYPLIKGERYKHLRVLKHQILKWLK